jgi:hypothetical protein
MGVSRNHDVSRAVSVIGYDQNRHLVGTRRATLERAYKGERVPIRLQSLG